MMAEVARLSLSMMPTGAGACELCTEQMAELPAVVVVQHPRGGTVRFAVCGRCTRAARRLVAAIGGHGEVLAEPEPAIREPLAAGDELFVRPPVLIGIVPDGFTGDDGARYIVRLYGDERVDGTWIGWIEFEEMRTGVTLRTGRETTQSNKQQLLYWASGLEPTYFDGALSRAR